jgi:hypothetical protein
MADQEEVAAIPLVEERVSVTGRQVETDRLPAENGRAFSGFGRGARSESEAGRR